MLKKFLKVAMTNNLKIVKGMFMAASFLASLALAQSASAVVFDWEFRNENGNIGLVPDGVVAGEVEFNDLDVFPGAVGVSATRLEITRVDGFDDPPSAPFLGDGNIELDTNLVPAALINSFDFDLSSQISLVYFSKDLEDASLSREFLVLRNLSLFPSSSLRSDSDLLTDTDSSSLSFSQQAATPVPFEINPTLGLLLVGGIFGSSRYLKHRNAVNK